MQDKPETDVLISGAGPGDGLQSAVGQPRGWVQTRRDANWVRTV